MLIYVSFHAKMATMGEIATQRSVINIYYHTFATTSSTIISGKKSYPCNKELFPCLLKDLFAPSKIGKRLYVCNYDK